MSAHRFPSCLCARMRIVSSSFVHAPRLMVGSRWLIHRSRHCFPRRCWLGKRRAISLHAFVPCSFTSLRGRRAAAIRSISRAGGRRETRAETRGRDTTVRHSSIPHSEAERALGFFRETGTGEKWRDPARAPREELVLLRRPCSRLLRARRRALARALAPGQDRAEGVVRERVVPARERR